MADPQAAVLTQLRNIQSRTGRSIAELHAELAGCGLARHGERRSWLMQQHGLGYGDANMVVTVFGKPLPGLEPAPAAPSAPAAAAPADAADPLDAIYAGAKAPLRPLHEAVLALARGLGDFEQAPKKAYVSLRRRRQFAMVGPATRDRLEIGLNCRDLPEHPRLKAEAPGGMCTHTLRLGSEAEVDADLQRWLRAAYDAAA